MQTATVSQKTLPIPNILTNFALLILSALLYAAAFPGFISKQGLFPLAFFAQIPLFILVRRVSWKGIGLYGLLYGVLAYGLFNFWLAKFHPLAIIIVPVIYAGYCLVLLPLLKGADRLFPEYGYIVQSLLWVAYEYVKVQGFIGYPYGIIGYSQYLFSPFIQIASITGVWGVSLLVIWPSAFLGAAVNRGTGRMRCFFQQQRFAALGYGILFIAALLFGFFSMHEYSEERQWKVALIQQNRDPWKDGKIAYRQSLDILKKQSTLALEYDPEIVVWSETSFVPSINWHLRFRQNRDYVNLIQDLLKYLSAHDTPFLIGNGAADLERDREGEMTRVNYNATLLFEDGEFTETYRKIHLVPFTEYFPYKTALPGIYNWLKEADTHFWEHGKEYTVFNSDGVRFSTPICFEDTFGYLSRNFVREGAQVIVNLTNDAWSYSEAAEIQHMAIAVFRAVENSRTVLRSTNGGITCSIDPDGRILDRLDAFVEGYLITEVPVYDGHQTLYTRWGDWFGFFCLIAALGALLIASLHRIRGQRQNRTEA